MALNFKEFLNSNNFSVLVNFPTKLRGVKNSSSIGYVLDRKIKDRISVLDYLKKNSNASLEKILKSLQIVKLKSSLADVYVSNLTRSEYKRLQLALVLLLQSKIIVCEYFFEDFIYSEKEYFKRFFRNLINKQGMYIILIERDMNFVCETVKQFYLFTKKGKVKLITDFYDEEIYQYVKMPFTVELVKYFQECGHEVDHDITFNETLKAIFRGAS